MLLIHGMPRGSKCDFATSQLASLYAALTIKIEILCLKKKRHLCFATISAEPQFYSFHGTKLAVVVCFGRVQWSFLCAFRRFSCCGRLGRISLQAPAGSIAVAEDGCRAHSLPISAARENIAWHHLLCCAVSPCRFTKALLKRVSTVNVFPRHEFFFLQPTNAIFCGLNNLFRSLCVGSSCPVLKLCFFTYVPNGSN